MPKPRLKQNRSLPKRWALKNGAYYYLVPPPEKPDWDNKSWFRLGSTLSEAHETYSKRIHKSIATVVTMQDLFDRFEFEYLSTLAVATKRYYLYALPRLRKIFTTTRIPVAAVEPFHAYQMSDHLAKNESKKIAKQCAECLSSALSYAVRIGAIKANPLIGQFKKPTTEGRNNDVTDEHLIAFVQTLPRKWQLYVMLKLHAKGRRKGELLRLMRSDLLPEGIKFTNNKRTDDVFIVAWTDQLRAIVQELLDDAPPRIGDAPLFFGKQYKAYINESGSTSGFDSIWQRYMTKAVTAKLCNHFTEHDLRRKAVENETLSGAAHLLRHTSSAVTAKHYRPKPERI